jgi:hypothetical protein
MASSAQLLTGCERKTGERDAILRSVAAKRLDKFLTKRRAEEPGGPLFVMPNGIGVFEVARNMGTSIQMIQEYYGKHATAAAFATRLGD